MRVINSLVPFCPGLSVLTVRMHCPRSLAAPGRSRALPARCRPPVPVRQGSDVGNCSNLRPVSAPVKTARPSNAYGSATRSSPTASDCCTDHRSSYHPSMLPALRRARGLGSCQRRRGAPRAGGVKALGENPRGLDHPTMGERWSCGCPSFALWGEAHGQGVAHRLPQAIAYGVGWRQFWPCANTYGTV